MGDCLGFTLVELMFVTSIIGILASIAIPHYIEYRKKAQVAKVASNLVNFEKGFTIYAIEQGGYPNDSHMVLPDQANMAKHIDPADWAKPTPLGGVPLIGKDRTTIHMPEFQYLRAPRRWRILCCLTS